MKTLNVNKWTKLGLGALAGAISVQAQAGTLNVCASGCAYSLPSSAMSAAVAGDTIQIQAGTYTDCVTVNKNNITLVGVNGMARLVDRVCMQKGIIVTAAQNAVIRNIELSGATNNSNYAGIRHDAAGFNLTLDNVYIHNNDNGILSSSSNDTLLIQNSRFENNGMNDANGYAHNLYIGRSASVTFLNSKSLSAKLAGHEFKTRAAKTVIEGSTIATLGGFDSRNIDVSNGGEVIIKNSVLEKGPYSDNGDMISYGPEGIDSARVNTFTMTGTILIGDRSGTSSVSYFANPTSRNISGNTYVAVSGAPAGNTIYTSRSAAGYQAYPWLPSPSSTPVATPTPTPTPAPTPTPTPVSDWTWCANENGTCSFSGTRTVRYGAGTSYATIVATGSVACNNATFGDPAYGVAKHCDFSNSTVVSPTPTPSPTPVATPVATPSPTPVPVQDTMAPSIAITSPSAGSTVVRNVNVTVNAADNIGVTQVSLYVDGVLVGSSSSAPFTMSWNTKKSSVGSHVLTVKARDAAGNVGTSSAVTVNVGR